MTKEDIEKAVQEIKDTNSDAEVAHSLEDGLRERFIDYVASTAQVELAEMARLVLSTDEIDFPRWCA
jgi:hypothetical protein